MEMRDEQFLKYGKKMEKEENVIKETWRRDEKGRKERWRECRRNKGKKRRRNT